MPNELASLSWQSILSSLREEAVIIGPDYSVLYANPFVLERRGISLNEAVSQHCRAVLHGEPEECLESTEKCPVRQALLTGTSASAIHRLIRPDGYREYYEVQATAIKDAEGNTIAALCLSRQAGIAERYQRIFDTMSDGVLVITHSGRLVDVNPALCSMMGYTREELADHNVVDFVPEHVAAALRDSTVEHGPYVEVAIPRRDRPPLTAEIGVSPLNLGPVSVYVAFLRDITRRKEWEETIAQQAEALARSEANYRTLFDNSGDALVVTDDDTTILMVNRRFEQMTGYKRDAVEGKMSALALGSEEERERILSIHRARREGLSRLPEHPRYWMTRRDGTRWLTEVSAAILPGTRRGLLALRDITDDHKLQQELLSRNRELNALYAVAAVVGRSTNINDMLNKVLKEALELTGYPRGTVFMLDEDQQRLVIRAHRGVHERLLKAADNLELGKSIGGMVAITGRPLFVTDITKEGNLGLIPVIEEGGKSAASVPLISSGRVLGVMTLGSNEERELSADTKRLLALMGGEIGVAMERAQLFQKAQQRAQELESLASVAREMASTLDFQEVLNRTLAIMCRQVGAEHGFICLLDEAEGKLTAGAFWGPLDEMTAKLRERRWNMGEGVVGWAASNQQAILCDNIAKDQRVKGSLAPSRGYGSIIAVPVKVKGNLLGVVSAVSPRLSAFNNTHLRLLSAYAAEASIALENALLHEEAKRQASTDDLTKLSNRRCFYLRLEDELKRARRYGHPLSLLFLDVDDLKTINDRYGHQQGDHLLQHMARQLAKVLRSSDEAARYGGDEFVILLPETSREEAAVVAERLLAEAVPCPLISGGDVTWRMSIGVAWAPVEGSYDVDLLRLADEAVYRAKEQGNGWDYARVSGRQIGLPLDSGEEA